MYGECCDGFQKYGKALYETWSFRSTIRSHMVEHSSKRYGLFTIYDSTVENNVVRYGTVQQDEIFNGRTLATQLQPTMVDEFTKQQSNYILTRGWLALMPT